jgi:Peptidase inhibitor I78 family
MRPLICALVGVAALSGAAAAQEPVTTSPAAACREAAASFVLGRTYSDRTARRARRAAGARVVRKVEPGQAYTMEFRADRLNLDVGPGGRIRAVRCG